MWLKLGLYLHKLLDLLYSTSVLYYQIMNVLIHSKFILFEPRAPFNARAVLTQAIWLVALFTCSLLSIMNVLTTNAFCLNQAGWLCLSVFDEDQVHLPHLCLLQVKVFCGAERPLVGKMCQSHDNLPGVSWQSSVDTSQIKSEHAVSAMIRLVNGNPGLYHLLCVHSLHSTENVISRLGFLAFKLVHVFTGC